MFLRVAAIVLIFLTRMYFLKTRPSNFPKYFVFLVLIKSVNKAFSKQTLTIKELA